MSHVTLTADHGAKYLEILQHSLGLDKYGQGTFYRNHFVTGPDGTDFSACTFLADNGLMTDHGAQGMYGGMHAFSVTPDGKDYVKRNSPVPPKLTRSQKRYLDYLAGDSGYSFGEWLKCRT